MPQGYLKLRGTPAEIKILSPEEKEASLKRLDSPYAPGNGTDVDQVVADARVRHTETLLPKDRPTSDKYGHRPLGAIVGTLTRT